MTNIKELRKRFEENIPRQDHEDNDVSVCRKLFWNCSCGRCHYYGSMLTQCPCKKMKSEGVYGDCDCGVEKEYEEQFAWFQSEIEAAEKAKVEEVIKQSKILLLPHASCKNCGRTRQWNKSHRTKCDLEPKIKGQIVLHIYEEIGLFLNTPE